MGRSPIPAFVRRLEPEDRAQLEHDVRVAADIQRALLPDLRRTTETFEVAASSQPCGAIGGDFLDYFDLPTGAFGFVLGDVTGKGPPAALLAAQLQGILAAQSYSGSTPAQTVTLANRALMRRPLEARFATLFFAELSSNGYLTYCNAGHNPPFVIGSGRVEQLEKGGVVLGAFKDVAFEQGAIQLDPADLLVVFTDGVTEAMSADREEFGVDRLLSFSTGHRDLPPAVFLERLLERIREFTVGEAQNDDLTALVLRQTRVR